MIDRFEGAYEFLSNYYDPCPVEYKNLTYRNSEAAYQAQKCRYSELMELFTELYPDDAKKWGKRVTPVPKWDEKRAEVMRKIVHAKFSQHPELATQLIGTGDEDLVEGNTWHDNFFGDCRCPKCKGIIGQNWLGLILMDERDRLKAEDGHGES